MKWFVACYLAFSFGFMACFAFITADPFVRKKKGKIFVGMQYRFYGLKDISGITCETEERLFR
jgi:hypothetical protein